MTIEEKSHLLKDLCARLPYGVKVHINSSIEEQNQMTLYDVNLESETIGVKNEQWAFRAIPIVDREDNAKIVKPYLRPLSSMTEEEIKEFRKNSDFEAREAYEVRANGENKIVILQADCDLSVKELDWLNAHHFDYRGLIEKGLALEALEGMYKEE